MVRRRLWPPRRTRGPALLVAGPGVLARFRRTAPWLVHRPKRYHRHGAHRSRPHRDRKDELERGRGRALLAHERYRGRAGCVDRRCPAPDTLSDASGGGFRAAPMVSRWQRPCALIAIALLAAAAIAVHGLAAGLVRDERFVTLGPGSRVLVVLL